VDVILSLSVFQLQSVLAHSSWLSDSVLPPASPFPALHGLATTGYLAGRQTEPESGVIKQIVLVQ